MSANGRKLPGPMALAMGQLGAALDDVRGALGDGTEAHGTSGRIDAADAAPDSGGGPPKGGPLAALNQRVEQLQQGLDASREEAKRRARLTLRLTAVQWTFFTLTLIITNWDTIGPFVHDAFARVVHGWGIEKFVQTEQQHERAKKELAHAEAELAKAHKELDASPNDPLKQDAVAEAAVKVRSLRREVEATQTVLDEYRQRYRK